MSSWRHCRLSAWGPAVVSDITTLGLSEPRPERLPDDSTKTVCEVCPCQVRLLALKVLTCLLTYSIQQSPSWEANRFSASQEIPRILWSPTVHHRIHKWPPPALSWANSIHSITPHATSSKSILILSSHLRLGIPSRLFPSCFPTRTLCTPLTYTIRATWPAHLILSEKSRVLKCFNSKRTNFLNRQLVCLHG